MNSKLNETLSGIFEVLTNWRNQEQTDIKTMEAIQELTHTYNEWEESEFRQALLKEMERNREIVISTVTFGGELPLREIEWDKKRG